MGLPDSLDICSMWGGIPAKENKAIWDEIRFVQKVKGTKMLSVAITRIDAETDDHGRGSALLYCEKVFCTHLIESGLPYLRHFCQLINVLSFHICDSTKS